MADHDLRAERIDYTGALLPDDLSDFDPFAQFATWLDDAFAEQAAGRLAEPAAMVLSTVGASSEGPRASARVVLLKEWDRDGFVFYTHHTSRKGTHLEATPGASLLFWWPSLMRQIRIEGTASTIDRADSERYFAERPRESQLGAWASHQSQPRESRADLEEDLEATRIRFADAEHVPCPPTWGGYRLVPAMVEFWQGQPGRLHDRIVAQRTDTGWTTGRLDP